MKECCRKKVKEVFDDLEDITIGFIFYDYRVKNGDKVIYKDRYNKLKKRHLSTFASDKSDIITDKSKSAKIDITKNIVAG